MKYKINDRNEKLEMKYKINTSSINIIKWNIILELKYKINSRNNNIIEWNIILEMKYNTRNEI